MAEVETEAEIEAEVVVSVSELESFDVDSLGEDVSPMENKKRRVIANVR